MEGTEEEFPAQWALDLLEPTPLDRSNHIFRYYAVPLTTIAITTAAVMKNILEKKPATANKPHIALATVAGFVLGCGIHWLSDIKFARKDAIMRDYIMRHPERFPKPDIKKYGDIFGEWIPFR
ncbi:NADH dehydrogenase [ubiquinone] 1 subunit C2 isoform X2 [Bombus impatiens]|uniref:NADH dehydrogenase [ubiquinone] 1 subunit C2 isoform X2 n=1 Tax=Bombus impatiens TaxID=132113 RepID=A0A6P8LH99_BOMIM|nr:NADH dehydrogenase [ubiquinone] 1 subunit C2 isoform X2 [Bombus impatiens]